ncbi:ABC transporter ATP-binding protein [Paenibacillus protaetiae]|uniref:ABC transporter ATP-binding protein n=1 Tax=Paenibacillus protaetiae TaxID=2509456 RepID=UPI0013EACA91|nr:ATP-binding cassette domain-containing protein [Paenibacillus protaetiae]
MEIYSIQNVTFTYPGQKNAVLSGINLSIPQGQFAVICGRSGSGKSTLLRQLKSVLAPHGKREGRILYAGKPIEDIGFRTQAAEIGFVQQNPDNGIVTDKVWHELAFGLESLGWGTPQIRLRVAEMAHFFGIQTWFLHNVSELSGGQKQLLNLASVMAMQPRVLILDEPTSQLDPIAAADFLATLGKINRELGTTILMTEHRLEEAIPLADRLIVMDEGRIIASDTPREAGGKLLRMNHPMFAAMPSPMRIYAGAGEGEGFALPLTVKEGRAWLNRTAAGGQPEQSDVRQSSLSGSAYAGAALNAGEAAGNGTAGRPKESGRETVVSFKDVWFRYDKHGADIIKGLSFQAGKGELYCIVGGNGTGKSTMLSLIGSLLHPYRGKITAGGTNLLKSGKGTRSPLPIISLLPQNPQTLFVKKTVRQDLLEMLSQSKLSKEERAAKVADMVRFTELEQLLDSHPYDLSGGEQQRAALAKVMLTEPAILLLDEPTKGLDAFFKAKLAALLRRLKHKGVTIIMVSHDIEFCAEYGDVCSLFFDGSIIATDTAKPFFAGNSFYTTAANRMSRHKWPGGITVEDVIRLCIGSKQHEPV